MRFRLITFAVCLVSGCLLPLETVHAGFGGGGRGGGGRGGGGISRPGGGGGMSRPAPRPNISAPNISRPSPKPNISRPSAPISRPQVKPSLPQSRPNISRPSGGLKPSPKPNFPTGGNRPNLPQRPTPQRPNVNRPDFNRPNTSLPNIPNRPTTRPSVPDRPTTLPSFPNKPGSRPGNLPGTRPDNRPGIGNPTRPNLPGNGTGSRPNLPGGNNRPSTRPNIPSGQRPTPGDLGDFLGMQKPLKPTTRPGTLPGTLPNRPGSGDLANRPNRPGSGNRPGNGNRPDWINKPGSNNNIINRRPSWVNIDNSTNININNRWSNTINRRGPGMATTLPANRYRYWNSWGSGVRRHWNYGRYHNCFGPRWWSGHYHPIGGWHYGYHFNRYSWNYWWRRPAWTAFGTWFVWSATYPQTWQEPVYYDYGQGGNVVYQDNSVYIGGEQIATTQEFAMSAADLATVDPPETEQQAEAAEWMPLGTFALSTGESDIDPSRVVQLAVDRQGIVSGTLYNSQTDSTESIQGKVDPETQRVAFRFGESETIVAETGLYNLTQDEAPLLVHFEAERTETYLLIRLDEPTEEAAQ